jgi:hypothetical protein
VQNVFETISTTASAYILAGRCKTLAFPSID